MEDGANGQPTGTVSFLFTDIEGSTALWDRHPQAMRVALSRHDAIVRTAINDHRGFVFSTAGDAFAAAFHTPIEALGAALEAQRLLQAEPWPLEAAVRVRMGLHVGNVAERDGYPTHPDTVICWQTIISIDAHHRRNDELRRDIASYAAAAEKVVDPYSAASHYALAALFPSATQEAPRYLAEAKRLAAGLTNPNLSALIGASEGVVAFASDRRGEAARILLEAKRTAQRADPYTRAIVTWTFALRSGASGFDVDPRSAYLEAIELLHELREWANLWLTLESLATWWADIERLEQAAVILGHLDAAGRAFMDLAGRRDRAMVAIKANPDGESWLARGANTDRHQLVNYVLDELKRG